MGPNPVHVTTLLKDFPKTIIVNRKKMKIKAPNPTLLIKSDSIYWATHGWSLGTNIIVTIADNTHFIKDMKLKENPFKKHWTTE